MPDVYSLKEVAEKLGIAPPTLKYHIYQSGLYAGFGRLIGHSTVFTQADVDQMMQKAKSMPRPGVPDSGRGEAAYRLHNEGGKSWEDVAAELGFKGGSGAFRAAKKYEAQLTKPKAKKK